MKKTTVFLWVAFISAICIFRAEAFVRYEDKHPQKVRDIRITGFIDYAPFGYTEYPDEVVRGRFFTVFQPMLDTFAKENNLEITYDVQKKDFLTLVQEVRKGKLDLVLGAYHQTELFKGLGLVYPAMITNNITVFMLPHRVGEVKKTDDLKKLKGVRIAKEFYSDFVENKLKEYNLETVNTEYELFEKLFTQKADYILGSHYYILIEAAKLGLGNQISPAKQALWQVPMFVGVSKISPQRKFIVQKLTRYLEKPENQEIIRQNLIRIVNEALEKGQSIVPPTFDQKEEKNNN